MILISISLAHCTMMTVIETLQGRCHVQ